MKKDLYSGYGDSYTSLNDSHSAIKEYYKLKQQLCLTAEEQFTIRYRAPHLIHETEEIIALIWEYIFNTGTRMYKLADQLDINRSALSLILYEHRQPTAEQREKLRKFLEGLNEYRAD